MLYTYPTRSEREMYDSCAPDHLWGEEEETVRAVEDDYYVECMNEGCGWSGLLSETKNDNFSDGVCPECGSLVEPV